jgi:aryl-alcohol dehydrogenase-like predicted oxidoreductase
LLFGLLSGKFGEKTTFGDNDHRRSNLSPEKLSGYLKEFEEYRPVFDKYHEYSTAQLSLRFCISNPACHTVIPGGKTPQQVLENVVASDLDFIPFDAFVK